MASEFEGILPLFKPKGLTSHDCVHQIRKLLQTKKVGHTGTLDPDVTGVLPLCIGRATKIVQYMTEYSKAYEAVVSLGKATTTEDATGEEISCEDVEIAPTRLQIHQKLKQFRGEIEQTPPMYSAVKINGKKLYEYARKGIVVERPTREVIIHEIQLLDEPITMDNGSVSFAIKVVCSKGTYIRTLAVDIGRALGYPAHMAKLIRTNSGPFTLEDCLSFQDIENLLNNNQLENHLLPIEKALGHLSRLTVNQTEEKKILNGAVLPFPKGIEENQFCVYNEEGQCIAIYQKHPNKPHMMKPQRILTNK
jgi:tRNA pseudouridine55 synthase